jgi:hypothetical protein
MGVAGCILVLRWGLQDQARNTIKRTPTITQAMISNLWVLQYAVAAEGSAW